MSDSLRIVAEALTRRASVESVFGQPISVGDRTFVPVARIQYGLGGGQDSQGAGGGLEATPLGLIELSEEGARYLPLGLPEAGQVPTESAPGIYALEDGWLLVHQGRFAVFGSPAPGAWLQHVAGPVDLVIGPSFAFFPQAQQVVGSEELWSGQLGGEPLFVLARAAGVVFRGALLWGSQGAVDNLPLPADYVVHTVLHGQGKLVHS